MNLRKIRAKDIQVGHEIVIGSMFEPRAVALIEHTESHNVVLWADDGRKSLIDSIPSEQWVLVEV